MDANAAGARHGILGSTVRWTAPIHPRSPLVATETTTDALARVTRSENGFNTRDLDALKGVDIITVRHGKIAEKLTYGTL
jgi:hypothetical protein